MLRLLFKNRTYTNGLVTLALVFAMTGGAWAATKYVITSTRQIKPSVLKQIEAKSVGSQGPQGPQGSVGAQGGRGEQGPQGLVGGAGEKGPSGATGATGAKGATGPSGQTGTTGAAGEPWSPNNVLPKKAMETGAWSEWRPAAEESTVVVPISFPIRVTAGSVTPHFLKALESTTECPGTRENPEATEGQLCVWPALEESASNAEFVAFLNPGKGAPFPGVDVAGTLLAFKVAKGASTIEARGTWAVMGS